LIYFFSWYSMSPMHLFRFILWIVVIVLTITTDSFALDLLEAFGKAKQNDPEYLAIFHDYKATETLRDQSVSKILPQVNLSYSTSRLGFSQNPNPRYYNDYRTEQTVFSVQQSVFNLPNFIEIKQSDLRGKAGEIWFRNAELNLIKRLADGYFDFLYAEENLKVLDEEKRAIEAQLNMAKRLFQAGEATLTDIHDAEARYYDVEFRLADAEKNLYAKKKVLSRMIGEEPVSVATLAERPPLEQIDPQKPDDWVAIAKTESPYVGFYALQRGVAEDELKKQRAQWLPSLALVANHIKTNTNDYLRTDTLSYRTVGIQVNMNILSGGYITAKINEAKERFLQAGKDYEKALSEVSQGIVESFFGVKSSVAGIQSSDSAVRASLLSVASTEKGYQAGIRTFVDVLNAESNLYRAKLNYLKSNYDYIKSLVSLYFYAGTVSEKQLAEINGWLMRR